MLPLRHLIVCEGESERAYVQGMQRFLDQQALPDGLFETPLRLISPVQAVAKSGSFAALVQQHASQRRANRGVSIQIWADYDLYHRNHQGCAVQYRNKNAGVPDFLFSFHNFEDFLALHWDRDRLERWRLFGERGHFREPLHSKEYLDGFQHLLPGYRKGEIPLDFISWESLRNLKTQLQYQPKSNPHDLADLRGFGEFLIGEIERAFPDRLV